MPSYDKNMEIVRYAKELREDNTEVKIRYKMIEVDEIRYRQNEREGTQWYKRSKERKE